MRKKEKFQTVLVKNLKDCAFSLAKHVLPAKVTGKMNIPVSQYPFLLELHQRGVIEIVGNEISIPQVTVAESVAQVQVVAEVMESEVEVEEKVILTLDEIDAMSREEILEYARKQSDLDIGRRTPHDVAKEKLKAYFGYVTE